MDIHEAFNELNSIDDSLNESSGLSRLWQYTHNSMSFAIIGSQDKDTKVDRSDELQSMIYELMENQVNVKKPSGKPMITYKKLVGNYLYDDGTQGHENSFLINNITKEQALTLGKKLNQESILWKDDTFFGYIYCDTGNTDVEFSRDAKNFSFNKNDVQSFGSRLKSKHNKGQGFTFVIEGYSYYHTKKIGIKEKLFSIDIPQ